MKLLFRSNVIMFGPVLSSDITSSSIKVSGNFTDHKSLASAKGFATKKHSSEEWTDAAVTAAAFSKNYTGLESNTEYDFRAYATINGVKQYSDVYSFTTLAEQVDE